MKYSLLTLLMDLPATAIALLHVRMMISLFCMNLLIEVNPQKLHDVPPKIQDHEPKNTILHECSNLIEQNYFCEQV